MSIFQPTPIPCPKCGTTVNFDLCHSINVDRRPDLRAVILDGSFQRETCGSCGTAFRMEPEFTYLDNARDQWIVAKPIDDLVHWEDAEAEAQRTWDLAWGRQASAPARAMMERVQPRITFGWSALVEKIALQAAGLDDVAIEIVKAGLIRGVPDSPLGAETELRFTGENTKVEPLTGTPDDEGDEVPLLQFTWLESRTGTFLRGIEAPRSFYDAVVDDPDMVLRREFDGLFVDFLKTFLVATPYQEAV